MQVPDRGILRCDVLYLLNSLIYFYQAVVPGLVLHGQHIESARLVHSTPQMTDVLSSHLISKPIHACGQLFNARPNCSSNPMNQHSPGCYEIIALR